MSFLKKIMGKESISSAPAKTVELEVTGMTCDHCASSIENLLAQNKGVKKVADRKSVV